MERKGRKGREERAIENACVCVCVCVFEVSAVS